MKFDQQTLIIVLAVIFVLWFLWPTNEGFYEYFDVTGSEFSPVGSIRYGLRGEPLHTSNIAKYYISPRRQIRLSQTHGDMYESNIPPPMQGEKACQKVKCSPLGHDNLDTCWTCDNFPQKPMQMPDIWPHVAV
ncbi:hypothetical protein Klosneuvirus_5_29 [Klosneuvirus KNV1]|uniref:Uncharacterized protein n=1 Tax=Klosneuvirus KNV1 TaxID=1977640 RepID=A0A1V0SKU0_9VIRU|nr:hypothetical protein Klosneuvirus_5_29 [Klosneuvirus KNV1]